MKLVANQKKPGWLNGLHGILTRIQARDEEAFEILLERVKKPSMRIIRSKLDPNYFGNEDLTIIFFHGMMKVWEKARTYYGRSNFDSNRDKDLIAWAWMKTILINCARDYRKAEIKYRQYEIPESLLHPEETDRPSIISIGDQRLDNEVSQAMENKEKAEDFINSLTSQEQEVFDHIGYGLSKKETARRMGITPSRVSQLISDLRKKVRRFIND